MELEEFKKSIEDAFNIIWDKLVIEQEKYFSVNKIYWQGIKNPTELPTEEKESSVNLSLKPSYQEKTWQDFKVLPDKLKFQIQIDQYVSPDKTCGFVATVFMNYNGDNYLFSKGYGKEKRDVAWTKIIE
jgi:hypothetical protein